jgi:hypothetical protein
MEMGAKVEAGLEAVNNPDDMCPHTGIGFHFFVGDQILRFEYPRHCCIDFKVMLRRIWANANKCSYFSEADWSNPDLACSLLFQ